MGVIRRIDDLGRVVVPKETHKILRLREGTPLEIFTGREGEIILKKYSPMVELTAPSGQYAEAMAQSAGMIVCIMDRDQMIAASGSSEKDMIQKTISKQLGHIIGERSVVIASKDNKAFISLISNETGGIVTQVITPTIYEGDVIGSVVLLSGDARAKFGDMEMKLVLTATAFLGCQMEA